MPSTEQQELDLAPLLVEGRRGGDGSRRQGRLEVLELCQIGLGLLKIGLQTDLLLGAARLQDLVLELLDLFGEGRELLVDLGDTADPRIRPRQVLLRALGGDDLEARELRRINLIALPMIPMKMGINDLADRVLRDPANLRVQRLGRRGLRMGIHHHDPVVGQDDRGIGIHFVLGRGNGGIDAIRHRLEFEELFVGGCRIGREGATEIEVIHRLDGCGRKPHTAQKLSTCPVRVHLCSSSHGGHEGCQSGPAAGESLPPRESAVW